MGSGSGSGSGSGRDRVRGAQLSGGSTSAPPARAALTRTEPAVDRALEPAAVQLPAATPAVYLPLPGDTPSGASIRATTSRVRARVRVRIRVRVVRVRVRSRIRVRVGVRVGLGLGLQ